MAPSAVSFMQNIVVSSAYMHTVPDLTKAGKSFVNKVKSVGPCRDPWGMPYETGAVLTLVFQLYYVSMVT